MGASPIPNGKVQGVRRSESEGFSPELFELPRVRELSEQLFDSLKKFTEIKWFIHPYDRAFFDVLFR